MRDYIESGILELYALGALPQEEMEEVKANILQYPELQLELNQILSGLESFSLSQARNPRPELKDKILNSLPFEDEKTEHQTIPFNAPLSTQAAKIIPIHRASTVLVRLLAAASVLLFLVSGFLLFQNLQYRQAIADLSGRLETTQKEYADMTVQLTSVKNWVAELQLPETKKIVLSSKTGNVNENAVLFMNQKSHTAKIYTEQLAACPKGLQYQLWAFVDGKPVNMGVLSNDSLQSPIQIPDMMRAQAFAITIEKTGGSPVPTSEKMVVFGTL